MPMIKRSSVMDLSDYFNRAGFADGDDAIAKDAGYDYREKAVELLNDIMAAKGLKWTAHEEDISSIHNTVYIVIKNERGEEMNIDASCDYTDGAARIAIEALDERDEKDWEIFQKKVWPHVWKEFNKHIEQCEKDRI